jgi:hypothetical protein
VSREVRKGFDHSHLAESVVRFDSLLDKQSPNRRTGIVGVTWEHLTILGEAERESAFFKSRLI